MTGISPLSGRPYTAHYREYLVKKDYIQKKLGYNYVELWQCQFDQLLRARAEVRSIAKLFGATIPPMNLRAALKGGRVETLYSHVQASLNTILDYLDFGTWC